MRTPSRPLVWAALLAAVAALLLGLTPAASAAPTPTPKPSAPGPSLPADLAKYAKCIEDAGENDIKIFICKSKKEWNDATEVVSDPGGALAGSAFESAAREFGKSADWFLKKLTSAFLDMSMVDLGSGGIRNTYEITWVLSATVAAFLLILQFGKTAIAANGSAAATALLGLARWALICLALFAVTQTALTATDEISEWMITQFYETEEQFYEHLGMAFGGFLLANSTNPAMVLLLGLLAIVLLLVLWGEMLLRDASIKVLVAVMPIVAAGTITSATSEWWTKARNAVISLVLIKPVIVLIFLIGFGEFGESKDVQGFLVGLLTILLACIAWPTLAKFMTFTTAGAGGGMASGLISAAGNTAGSLFANRAGGGVPSGSGAIGNGRGYTKGVEAENDTAVTQAGGGASKSGGSGMGPLAAVAMAAQAAKAGKEVVEGGMENMAAHAGLGPGKDMGGSVTLPPGDGGGGGDDGPPAPPAEPGGPPPGPDVSVDRVGELPPKPQPPAVGEGGQTPPVVKPGGQTPPAIAPAPRKPLALPPAPPKGGGPDGST